MMKNDFCLFCITLFKTHVNSTMEKFILQYPHLGSFPDYFQMINTNILSQLISYFILGTIFIHKGTKNPKIVLDGHDYQINTKKKDRTLWRCSHYFKTKCKATLITTGNCCTQRHDHNHVPTLLNSSHLALVKQRVILQRIP